MDQPFDNSDDSFFKSHVLYVLPGDGNCVKVENFLSNHPFESQTWVQNVKNLNPPLPNWLKGVPTLVSKQDKKVYTGQSIFTYLQERLVSMNNNDFVPSNSLSSFASQFDASPLHGPGMFNLEYDESPTEIKNTPSHANAQWNSIHGPASLDENGAYNLLDADAAETRNNVQPSAGLEEKNNLVSEKSSRRLKEQNDHLARVQRRLQDERDALDRRLNPAPGFQRQ